VFEALLHKSLTRKFSKSAIGDTMLEQDTRERAQYTQYRTRQGLL
jgi:hypothetical protein